MALFESRIYSEFINSTDGDGLDSEWLDAGRVSASTNLAIDRAGQPMEPAHSDPKVEVSTLEHILMCLGILLTIGLLIYFS